MLSELSDQELLRRFVFERAEPAFAELVRRHLDLVFGAAFRQLQDRGLAEDVVQTVFLALGQRAAWLLNHPRLAGWLYRTAIQQARQRRRGERRRQVREAAAIAAETIMNTDESLLRGIAPLLDEVLLELGAADRETLLLRYLQNQSLREVGRALGVPEDTARKRVGRALEALAARFRRRGYRAAGAGVVALALQHAAAHAAPPALAAAALQTALAGAASPANSFTITLAKIMTLTKIQSTVVCVALIGLPLTCEWQKMKAMRDVNSRLSQELQAWQNSTRRAELADAGASATIAPLENGPSAPAPRNGGGAPTNRGPDLYAWDEQSPYVRVPTGVLAKLHFGEYKSVKDRNGSLKRVLMVPFDQSGAPDPALLAAIGASPAEEAALSALCQSAFSQFNQLSASRTSIVPGKIGTSDTMTMTTLPFPDEGAQLRDSFHAQVLNLLGADRGEAFWAQGQDAFHDLLNDFGAFRHELKVVNSPDQVEMFNIDDRGGRVSALDQFSFPLPAQLQSYVNQWRANAAGK